jgi:hypothetical protein
MPFNQLKCRIGIVFDLVCEMTEDWVFVKLLKRLFLMAVRPFSTKDNGMSHVSAEFIPWPLTQEQKEHCLNV